MRLEPRAQTWPRDRADEPVDLVAIAQQQQQRDALGAEARGDLGSGVDVELDDLDVTGVVARHLLDEWREHAARAAPRGPEVHQDRQRRIDRDVEGGRIGVDDPGQSRVAEAAARNAVPTWRHAVAFAAIRAGDCRCAGHGRWCRAFHRARHLVR